MKLARRKSDDVVPVEALPLRVAKLQPESIVDLAVRTTFRLCEAAGEVDEAIEEDVRTVVVAALLALHGQDRDMLRRAANAALDHNRSDMWADLALTSTELLRAAKSLEGRAHAAEVLAVVAEGWLRQIRDDEGRPLAIDAADVARVTLNAFQRREGPRKLATTIAKLGGIHATTRAVKAAKTRVRKRAG
jgi:hypothetical protein